MPQKETLMYIARCKARDGRILDYYVHRIAGDVVIIGPNLERHRCHPGITNAQAARIEIAEVYRVEVISISEWPLKHPGTVIRPSSPKI
jgi:hypothetical protein